MTTFPAKSNTYFLQQHENDPITPWRNRNKTLPE